MPYLPDRVVVGMKWDDSCANTLNSLKHNTHFITVTYSLADSLCPTSFVKFYKTPCVLLEISDHLSYLSEMCQKGHLSWWWAIILFTGDFKFVPCLLILHLPPVRGLSVSHWREALVCVSHSRTALDYVWMGDIRGVLNCGDVCASHFRKVLYCVCTSHSKDTLLALVLVHTAGEVGFALSHSQRSFVPVSWTLWVATMGQQL